MATFNDDTDFKTFRAYKAALKVALNKVNASGINFQYYEKFSFDDKERALVLVDFATAIKTAGGKKPTATGKCKLNAADKLVFEASGTVNVDKVTRLMADAGISRAVAHPDDKANAPSQLPEGTKLNMKYGWTEMRKWGDEAQELIDGFDGLVGIYKSLPEVKPEWTKLSERHEEIKQAMKAMVGTEIENDKAEREKKLKEIQGLVDTVSKLATDLRAQALLDKQPKPVPKKTETPPPVEKTVQPTTETPTPKPTKPVIDVGALKDYAITNASLNAKDTLKKYMARAKRHLEASYTGVTPKHLEAVEKMAHARYFREETAPTTTTPPPTTPVTPVVPWTARVLDLNGAVADLSSLDKTTQGKIEEIVLTGGRNDHGDTVLSGSNPVCKHWTVGKGDRIFGNVVGGNFVLVGTGTHTGTGNKKYKVDLLLGGTCTATVA